MSLDKAHQLKKQAFHALDTSRRGTTVRVNFNDLIDVCLAYEAAAQGNTEQLEFSNAINYHRYLGLRRILDRIADKVPVDSEIWKLCHSEYDPEFNVDPDAVLAKMRG